MTNRISKEELFMNIAGLLRKRSTCSLLAVGCVITDSDMKHILSFGYNGNYSGGPNECDRVEPGNCGCIHAETNALIKCNDRSKDKVLFTTSEPCSDCAKLIINNGFKKVYYSYSFGDSSGRKLLDKEGIFTDKIKLD